MIFADMVNRGPIAALEKLMAYSEARQHMLAENVANIDNPHYRTKHLDTKAFQRSLREALDQQKASGASTFELPAGEDFRADSDGHLKVTPAERPADNVLFHDNTNASVEKQMAMMAENGMMHQTATELLRGRFEDLLKAIRGRT
jgi:flagellar basal-body rod protein FlgB